MLESSDTEQATREAIENAKMHGFRRCQQGNAIPLLVPHVRLVEQAIYEVIHEHLMSLNLSYFMFDLKRLNASLSIQLEHTLLAYLEAERRIGRQSGQQQ